MRKFFLLTAIIVMTMFPMATFAQTDNIQSTIEYLDDGSYYETIITDEPLTANDISLTATTQTVTKSKTTYFKNADGDTMWYVKVTGTFTYGNGSSKCTSSSVTAVSKNSDWKISSKSASKSANKATASATAKKYHLGVLIQTKSKTVTLTCSSTGTFS